MTLFEVNRRTGTMHQGRCSEERKRMPVTLPPVIFYARCPHGPRPVPWVAHRPGVLDTDPRPIPECECRR